PVAREASATVSLPPLKISVIAVMTMELLKTATLDAETLVRNDLVAAVVSLSDRSFIDPTVAAVAGVSPASVTNGALTVASGADLATDLKALLNLFTGELDRAVMVTNP